MDETVFAVDDTQSMRIIVDSTQKSNWKVTAGKQEWVTCVGMCRRNRRLPTTNCYF
ncbi:hypothetical protein LIPSTDRAFT_71705 [Lipomyces starkeyi NRRL Y-11557]|uniref:Uncharacterized protein n=1 Tax=Lipomyces starkeyi NRRL Y-11557 TaxID=675824 RepID=A0A1E3Q6J3_LIPST|nr:hypothetical protein LIPSTDRAFT_71705 [Lipomyces starkeyi NRRL Y-11557]